MFSGIVEERAQIASIQNSASSKRITVRSALNHSDTRTGDSICIGGVCLTVVGVKGAEISFDVSEETLRRSILGELRTGDHVNLERSVKHGDRLHGHLVFGHVDTVARLISREPEGGSEKLVFSIDPETSRFLVEKGSISVSGVSLTVGEVNKDGFSVYVIPHTSKVTTLPLLKTGDKVNIEVDMLARYVYKILKETGDPASSSITEDFLARHGYVKVRH